MADGPDVVLCAWFISEFYYGIIFVTCRLVRGCALNMPRIVTHDDYAIFTPPPFIVTTCYNLQDSPTASGPLGKTMLYPVVFRIVGLLLRDKIIIDLVRTPIQVRSAAQFAARESRGQPRTVVKRLNVN